MNIEQAKHIRSIFYLLRDCITYFELSLRNSNKVAYDKMHEVQ